MSAKQYYVVDEQGRLQTLTEVNPPCEAKNTVEVTSDLDGNVKRYHYYTFKIYGHKKGALTEYLQRKTIELEYERKNLESVQDRIERLQNEVTEVQGTINQLY